MLQCSHGGFVSYHGNSFILSRATHAYCVERFLIIILVALFCPMSYRDSSGVCIFQSVYIVN